MFRKCRLNEKELKIPFNVPINMFLSMRWTPNCRPIVAIKTIQTSMETMGLLTPVLLLARMESVENFSCMKKQYQKLKN